MPIYELECTNCHNKEEKLFTAYMNFISEEEAKRKHQEWLKEQTIPGYEVIDTTPVVQNVGAPDIQKCVVCGGFMELIPSLPAMHPDTMWSGQMTQQGYFTSQKKLNQFRKERHIEKVDRSIIEEIQKKAEQRPQKLFEKTQKDVQRCIDRYIADDL